MVAAAGRLILCSQLGTVLYMKLIKINLTDKAFQFVLVLIIYTVGKTFTSATLLLYLYFVDQFFSKALCILFQQHALTHITILLLKIEFSCHYFLNKYIFGENIFKV